MAEGLALSNMGQHGGPQGSLGTGCYSGWGGGHTDTEPAGDQDCKQTACKVLPTKAGKLGKEKQHEVGGRSGPPQ